MRLWAFDVETRRVTHTRVVAETYSDAFQIVQRGLTKGDRLLQGGEVVLERKADQAQAAVRHLLRRAFLPIAGMEASVQDWVAEAMAGNPVANARLAVAGLRLRADDTLAIGSPGSVPQLRDWFARTAWPGAELHLALMALPGAKRINAPLTMAGVSSRCVALPIAVVMADGGTA